MIVNLIPPCLALILSLLLSDIDLTVTAYSPRVQETNSQPFITANMTRVRKGIVAVSRDIKKFTNYGDYIIILTDDGDIEMLEIQDLMNIRWKMKIDKFFFNTDDAYDFGVKKAKAVFLCKLKKERI